jgi:hypothetical protein
LGLLPQSLDGPLHAGKLVVGIRNANGAFQGVPNTSVDSAGRSYQMAIPAGTPLKLWLSAVTSRSAIPAGTRLLWALRLLSRR